MNCVLISGHLGKDVIQLPSGTYALSVAIKEGNDKTLWVDVLLFNGFEGILPYLQKGKQVLVRGRISIGKENITTPKIIAKEIDLL